MAFPMLLFFNLIMYGILFTEPVPILFAQMLRIDIKSTQKWITVSVMSISTIQRMVAVIIIESRVIKMTTSKLSLQ